MELKSENEDIFDSYNWYQGLCNDKEIDRIRNPKSGRDILLKERADIIVDETRLYRLFMHKQRKVNEVKKWSFESQFTSSHYSTVLKFLPYDIRTRCRKITYGDMFAKKVNAYAYPDQTWGEFICINMGMKYFMYFINLALCNPIKFNIPPHVILNATRIAIRIWLGNEALDFEMDPRGKVSYDIMKQMQNLIPYELSYIAGHEYSHHILNHFDGGETSKKILWSNSNNTYQKEIYNATQKQELDADISSLTIPKYNERLYKNIYEGALKWFISLDLAELATECICPSSESDYKTHPSALQRYNNILQNVKKPANFNEKEFVVLIEQAKVLKEFIAKDIMENYAELYDEEVYGSVYLDKPNTKWRGRELVDRVDY